MPHAILPPMSSCIYTMLHYTHTPLPACFLHRRLCSSALSSLTIFLWRPCFLPSFHTFLPFYTQGGFWAGRKEKGQGRTLVWGTAWTAWACRVCCLPSFVCIYSWALPYCLYKFGKAFRCFCDICDFLILSVFGLLKRPVSGRACGCVYPIHLVQVSTSVLVAIFWALTPFLVKHVVGGRRGGITACTPPPAAVWWKWQLPSVDLPPQCNPTWDPVPSPWKWRPTFPTCLSSA